MSESIPNQGVSTEVKGEFSPIQRQEYGFLGQQVLQARGLDPEKPKNMEDVKAFMDDTLERGLNVQGRIWFSPTDSIISAFDSGLSIRERVIQRLKEVPDSENDTNYISKEEADSLREFVNSASVFSPELSVEEEFLKSIEDRKKSVSEFQKLLFDKSPLASDASELRKTAKENNFTAEDTNNALYRNLLLHLALYLRPGAQVEPKDLAALSDLWNSKVSQAHGEESIMARMEEFARRAGLDDKAIGIYTGRLLDAFELYTGGEKVDFEDIKATSNFIFSDRSITQEEHEQQGKFLESEKVMHVNEEDLEIAQDKFKKAKELYDALKTTLTDEEIERNTDESLEIFKRLTPFEVALFIDKSSIDGTTTDEFKRDLIEFPETGAYIDALQFAYADRVLLYNSDVFSDNLNLLKEKIGDRVKDDIIDEKVKLEDIVNDIPGEFLVEVLSLSLSDEQREFLTNLDVDRWVYFLQKTGAVVRGTDYDEGVGKIIFSPDSERLRSYIGEMSEGKQDEIVRALQQTVNF